MSTITFSTQITSFLKQIGIKSSYQSLTDKTFLPGLLIDQGSLIIDTEKMKYPGDILHEAGHIAVTPEQERKNLSGDVHRCGHGPAEEMAAIAWSWAACLELNLPPNVLFHADGYRGASQTYIEAFTKNSGFGHPLLSYWGLTEPLGKPGGYPNMTRWLR
ncbi:MAG: hypothetical protein P8X74_08765 [Reinekea sp.]